MTTRYEDPDDINPDTGRPRGEEREMERLMRARADALAMLAEEEDESDSYLPLKELLGNVDTAIEVYLTELARSKQLIEQGYRDDSSEVQSNSNKLHKYHTALFVASNNVLFTDREKESIRKALSS